MKKILILLLIAPVLGFGQEDIKQGLVTKYYEGGEVSSKTNYVDGKRQGERSNEQFVILPWILK